MIDREDVLRQVQAGSLSASKAGKILGISRQRVGRIVKDRRQFRPPPPAPTAPSSPPPPTPPAPTEAAPVPEESKNALEALLREAGAGPMGSPPPAPTAAPPAAPPIDPREAEAGKALAEMLSGGVGVSIASRAYKIKATDPRLSPLRTPNKFLSLSLDMNQDKTAMVGRWAGGWKGLGIGFLIEAVRAIFFCETLGLEPSASVSKSAGDASAPAGPTEEEAESGDGEVVDGGGFSISRAKAEAKGEA